VFITSFSYTIMSFAKKVLELAQTVERMTLEGLGVREESIAWQLSSQSHTVRMVLYGTPPDKETSISLGAHSDDHMTTVIAQHEVGGLEVQVNGGQWIAVPPEPGTLIFIGGDQLMVNSRRPNYTTIFICWSL
jgi:isopenicillin N synthase-like dioxygenase